MLYCCQEKTKQSCTGGKGLNTQEGVDDSTQVNHIREEKQSQAAEGENRTARRN